MPGISTRMAKNMRKSLTKRGFVERLPAMSSLCPEYADRQDMMVEGYRLVRPYSRSVKKEEVEMGEEEVEMGEEEVDEEEEEEGHDSECKYLSQATLVRWLSWHPMDLCVIKLRCVCDVM